MSNLTLNLLKVDVARLQAFHMRSLHRVTEVHSFGYATNAEVMDRTRLENMEPRIRRRRLPPFGHMARKQPDVPACDALSSALDVRCSSVRDPAESDPVGAPGSPGLSS